MDKDSSSQQPPRGSDDRRCRRRRKKDSVELTLFAYVRSQCQNEQHKFVDYCTFRHCEDQNKDCLERLLKSARKSIKVAMYVLSVQSLADTLITAKNNNVNVQVIIDSTMRLNGGTTFPDLVANDIDIKWPKATGSAMAALMHHKFILIDAEPRKRAATGEDGDESESDCEEEFDLCEKCKAEEGSGNVQKKCLKCRPVRIRSKEDLIRFPSQVLPRLPKHGLLITGSLNWTCQAFRENFENVLITSHPQHITDYLEEFNYLWTEGLRKEYVPFVQPK